MTIPILKALAQKLFGKTIEPEAVKRIETADLNSPNGHPHYYYADRQADGTYRITHAENSDRGNGPIIKMRHDDVPYSLNEAIDLLSRFEKTEGLFPGANKSYRMFIESSRPEYFKAKLKDHYQKSEIETDLFGESPQSIMILKRTSLAATEHAMAKMKLQGRSFNLDDY